MGAMRLFGAYLSFSRTLGIMTVWDKGDWKMTKDELLKLNLQFFSEEGEEGEVDGDEKEGQEEHDDTTFTRSDVDREISKAVQSALDKRDKKHQEEMQRAIEDAIAEKERLSKLSEKERQEEQLTQREKEIAEREAEIARKELKADAIADLNDKGLPSEFADILLGEDAESTLENINTFKTTFDEAVNAAVKERLRQETPKTGGTNFGKVPSIAQMAQENRIIK